jgi:hypothetical protein
MPEPPAPHNGAFDGAFEPFETEWSGSFVISEF